MSILLGHSSIRPMTSVLQKVNQICEKEMIGFALLSKKGFLRAADSLFLSFLDKKIISVGTIPQADIEKTFLTKILPANASQINTWIRGNTPASGGLWQTSVPFGEASLELFRAAITDSDEEAVLFFRVANHSASLDNSLSRIFTELSEEMASILLDSLDPSDNDAIELKKRILEQVNTHIAHGEAYFRNNQIRKAVQSFREALLIRPSDPRAQKDLDMALEAQALGNNSRHPSSSPQSPAPRL